MKKNRPKLIVAASETSSDMLYATGFHAPDPFAFAEVDGCRSILLSDLEVDRGRKEAEVDQVFAYSDIEEVVQGRKKRKPDYAFVLAAWLHALGTQEVDVPADFPFLLARQLEKLGVQLNPVDGFFWPTRECKSADQLKAVRRAVQLTETGMERALQVLRAAKIRRDGFLTWGGGLLTSERLRSELEGAILMAGGQITSRSIVAGGEQACDPHERGSGPLRAHTLIILDVFPRDPESGYYGDITRTVVRGQATAAQRQLWKVCLKGQKYALQQMAPGVSGETIHEAIKAQFAQAGYPTEQRDGRWVGFFHGTGHGLGLDLHEPPRFSRTIFKPGQVLTVEPGIYWPGVGGVRHEDDVVVTETGVQKLSRIPKVLEI